MTLEQKIERAKQIRRTAMMNAETLEDAKAAEVPTLYPVWKTGEAVEVDDRRYYEYSSSRASRAICVLCQS